MSDQKKSKFGLGVFFGAIIGAITALFFTPKSGKEMRKDVGKKIDELKKIIEEEKVDEKLKELYFKAKNWLVDELEQLKKTVEKLDYEKYKKAVNKVIDRVKKETKKGAKEVEKLKKQLLAEWEKLKE